MILLHFVAVIGQSEQAGLQRFFERIQGFGWSSLIDLNGSLRVLNLGILDISVLSAVLNTGIDFDGSLRVLNLWFFGVFSPIRGIYRDRL